MRSQVLVLVLLSATAAWGGEAKVTVAGKVVAVENDGSVWVYLPGVRASYHVSLSGVAAPPLGQPLEQTIRSSLTQLVLGREVLLRVDRLNTVGLTSGEVFLQGRSVNTQLAALMAGRTAKPDPLVYSAPVHRPLLTLCTLIRSRFSRATEPAADRSALPGLGKTRIKMSSLGPPSGSLRIPAAVGFERRRQVADQVGGDQRFLAEFFGGQVAGQTVEIDAEPSGVEGR